MVSRTVETPVLIIGAGPVGLGLALDLAWRGCESTLVEVADSKPVLHPRAGGVAARTMEFCRRWGIAEEVIACGFPRNRQMDVVFCTSLAGHLLARHEFPPLGSRTSPPFSPENRERCPQIWFDPILARAVARRADRVRALYRHRLIAFEQTPDCVMADVRDESTGDAIKVVAQYMIACDGNESAVRDALGIEVAGDPVLSYSVNANIETPTLNAKNPTGEGIRYLFIGPTGTWANMTAVDGQALWRFTLIGQRQKMDLSNLDMAAEVRRAWGTDDIPFKVLTVAPWRRKELNASRYQAGRVFLAGDAAHTMSPTGGAGMNTGMGDAVDLGWKLAAVIEGWGGPALLQTYDLERRPVGWRNARWSSGNFKNWKPQAHWPNLLDDTPAGEAARRQIGEGFRSSLSDEWISWGIQLGYRYEGSPICLPDGTPAPPDPPGDYVQTARPGSRAPHAWLAEGRSTLDLFGRGFVLLGFSADPADLQAFARSAQARHIPLEIHPIEAPAIAALYERKLVLVRPDGHVAWRADRIDGDPGRFLDIACGRFPPPQAAAAGPTGRITVKQL